MGRLYPLGTAAVMAAWPVGRADLLIYRHQVTHIQKPWGGDFPLLYPKVLADAGPSTSARRWKPGAGAGRWCTRFGFGRLLFDYLLNRRHPPGHRAPHAEIQLVDRRSPQAGRLFCHRCRGRSLAADSQPPDTLLQALDLAGGCSPIGRYHPVSLDVSTPARTAGSASIRWAGGFSRLRAAAGQPQIGPPLRDAREHPPQATNGQDLSTASRTTGRRDRLTVDYDDYLTPRRSSVDRQASKRSPQENRDRQPQRKAAVGEQLPITYTKGFVSRPHRPVFLEPEETTHTAKAEPTTVRAARPPPGG